LACGKKLRVSSKRIDVTKVIQWLNRNQVSKEFLGSRVCANIDVSRKQIVPKLHIAHRIEHVLFLSVYRTGICPDRRGRWG
jgi:hypothetical protein